MRWQGGRQKLAGIGRVARREWRGGGKVRRARMDGKTWRCMVAVAEADKRDGVEHCKHDTSCFLRRPVGRSGEPDRSLLSARFPPPSTSHLKKYLSRAPLGYWPVTFTYSEAEALGRAARHLPSSRTVER